MRGLLEVLLLDAIAREPKHGYALIQELEVVFGVAPNRNQVYPLLNRLEKNGFLQADREGGRGKTRYALTGKGLELLKEYRLRPPPFQERIAALWLPDLAARAAAPATTAAPAAAAPPAPTEAPRPHLVDRLALAAEAPRTEPIGAGHAGGPCTAEVLLRRRGSGDRVAFEAAGLDPGCPTCRDLADGLRGLRDRWF